jgi:uncharacterized protein (TIGR02466 family)
MDFAIPATSKIFFGFATPVMVRPIAGHGPVTAALRAEILAMAEADGGVVVSNRGGWQSKADFRVGESDAVEAYRGWVDGCVRRMAALPTGETELSRVDVEYEAVAWANVNGAGAYNDAHIHANNDWAVVCYVDAGGAKEPGWDRNGMIELHDPRALAQTSDLAAYGFARSFLLDPQPGQMLMFPAWMEHSVHPFYGAGTRISIACNIRITGGRHSGRQ